MNDFMIVYAPVIILVLSIVVAFWVAGKDDTNFKDDES